MSHKNLGPLYVSSSFQRLLQLDPDDNKTIIVGTGSAPSQVEFGGAVTASYFVGDGSKLTNVLSGSTLYSSSAQLQTALNGQDLTLRTLVAQQFVVSSSVIHVTQSYSSGSSAFGNSLDDTHIFTGSISFTGSIAGNGSGLSFPSTGIVSSSAQIASLGYLTSSGSVRWTDVESKPTNLISSSGQRSVLGLGPSDTVGFGIVNATHSVITGNLSVAGTITAREYAVSSSVLIVTTSYASGSNKFGDTLDDKHEFTGSLEVMGGITGSFSGNGSALTFQSTGIVSSSNQTVANLVGQNVVVNTLTAQQFVVSSSVIYLTQSYMSGSSAFGNSLDDTHVFTGSLYVTGSINGNGSGLTNISTSSITNFDTEVSRSVATYGFGTSLPSGVVSSSAQTLANLNGTNIVSSSAQRSVLGLATTDNVQFATLTAVHGTYTGNVVVQGTFTAREYVISSSVMVVTQSYSSGSTVFGDTLNDTHQFTGSLSVSGSFLFDEIDGGSY